MAEVKVAGKQYSQEDLEKAISLMEKFKAQREKAKASRKEMTPEQKVAYVRAVKLRQAKQKLILIEAAKKGINPTDAEVVAFAKAQKMIV
jgi:hypothetical protein